MNILITGYDGFIGKNLVSTLRKSNNTLLLYGKDNTDTEFEAMIKSCDVIVHLAGTNRSNDEKSFIEGNIDLTSKLIDLHGKNESRSKIIFTSSIQAVQDNIYGNSKLQAEEKLVSYASKRGVELSIYRLQNIFGKWSRPNYNSVIATWCFNISRDLPIKVENRDIELDLLYIDDLISTIENNINHKVTVSKRYIANVIPGYITTLGNIYDLLMNFKMNRSTLLIPDLEDEFTKKLFSTYLSYNPITSHQYDLLSHVDSRGSFTEFLKSDTFGQVSINVSKPGIEKGNHWHHTKIEKFLVVSGEGKITLEDIITHEFISFDVSGTKLTVVDIPPGYNHSIINTGNEDLVTIIWVNEIFSEDNPDTFTNI